ncbi:translation elongation factor [Sulfolobus acidocaldarius SUSAZ]|nr:translation elongation factor [Sulfolobus acidocaldarius SUSAZ]
MLKGSIITVLASTETDALNVAERLGKRVESSIYYKKFGEHIRSILVPQKLLDQAEALSISSAFYLKMSQITSVEGEFALLAEASGLKGVVLPPEDSSAFEKIFKDLSIVSMVTNEFKETDGDLNDRGYVYVDRAFNVKGVGTVVLGFSLTEVRPHDKLIALPMKKEVEVKSIQVLDEDQEGVLPGVRIGFALKNVKIEDIEGVTALVKPNIKLINSIQGFTKFKWTSDTDSVHVVAGGIKTIGKIDNNIITLKEEIPITVGRAILLNLNAKPKSSRVYGYAEIK